MPFRYRLQKVIEFRIRKKEEQLQIVIKAQAEVARIEGLIEQGKFSKEKEIKEKAFSREVIVQLIRPFVFQLFLY